MAETNRIGSGAWTVPHGMRWREADARGMVVALRASGEGIADFARRHGLHEERVRGDRSPVNRPLTGVAADEFRERTLSAKTPTE